MTRAFACLEDVRPQIAATCKGASEDLAVATARESTADQTETRANSGGLEPISATCSTTLH